MKKGWDSEYLIKMKEKTEKKIILAKSKDEEDRLKEDIDVYDMLMLTLLFSDAISIEEKISIKQFLEYIEGSTFEYKLSKEDEEKICKYGLEFAKLKKIKTKFKNEHISKDESISIVGDFIKSKFNSKHYDGFNSVFNGNYVLFDSSNDGDLAYTVSVDNEIFVRIPMTEDIKMLSSIGHEAGHAFRMMNNINTIYSNYFGEYESFFYELNLLSWLIKNNIYKDEAINYFLYIFKLIEQVLYMRYLIGNYRLNEITKVNDFEIIVSKLKIKERLNLSDNQELFNYFITTLDMDIRSYFYSFLAVLNSMEKENSLQIYENVVRSIDNENEEYILRTILGGSALDINQYTNYRNILQKRLIKTDV